MLDKFSLTRWATFGFEDLPISRSMEATPSTPSATQDELSKITVTLAEEMFQILIYLVLERFHPGVGQVTMADALQREVVHLLSTGASPFSHIERFVNNNQAYRKESLEEAVRAVGDFRKPGSAGVFVLKPEARARYNAFFWHYSRASISQAEQQQKKDRQNEAREVRACPPPVCPSFEPFYRPITRLLSCR